MGARCAPVFIGSCLSASAAAAAGKKDDGYDYKPDPFVVKKIAKTVIHIKSSVVVL